MFAVAQRRKARRLLMQALYQWRLTNSEPEAIAAEFMAGSHGKVDWEYFQRVFRGVTRGRDELLARLRPLLDRDADSLTPVEWAILLLGAHELQQGDEVPNKVAINEAVELAKNYGATDSYKYINGVLDALARPLSQSDLQPEKMHQEKTT